MGIFSFIYLKRNSYENTYYYFLIAIFALSVISWLYNFFVYKNIDIIGLAIWWLTNLFPFFVIILVIRLNRDIDAEKLIDFYRFILLIQLLIIIFQSTGKNNFYGDHAIGTCSSAHFLAFHFSIGIILTLAMIFTSPKKRYGLDFLMLLIFYTGLISTAFKANIVFLFIILFLFFLYHLLKKIVWYRKDFKKYAGVAAAFIIVIIFGVITLIGTYMLKDIDKVTERTLTSEMVDTVKSEIVDITTSEKFDTISEENDMVRDESLQILGGKIYAYYVSFLKVPGEINVITGYGPATYTSRAAQYRMIKIFYYAKNQLVEKLGFSEERAEKLLENLEPEMSRIFEKYLINMKFTSYLNAPMSSIISVWVELGILGMAFFIWFFAYLFIRLKSSNLQVKANEAYSLFFKNDFMGLLLVLLIFNMFYYNYWEYPEMVIPIMTFVIISIENKSFLNKKIII